MTRAPQLERQRVVGLFALPAPEEREERVQRARFLAEVVGRERCQILLLQPAFPQPAAQQGGGAQREVLVQPPEPLGPRAGEEIPLRRVLEHGIEIAVHPRLERRHQRAVLKGDDLLRQQQRDVVEADAGEVRLDGRFAQPRGQRVQVHLRRRQRAHQEEVAHARSARCSPAGTRG